MFSSRSIGLIAAFSFLWVSTGSLAAQTEALYRIGPVDGEPLHLRVEAVVSSGERLVMSDYGAWSQPRGWAHFIRDLRVADSSGALDVVAIESGWSVAPTEDARLELSYEVDLSHAAWIEWPDGPRTTAAFSDSGAVFALAGALLVYTSADEVCRLSFDDSGWKRVAAPFSSSRPGEYQVASIGRAVDNVVAFGDLELVELTLGSMHVQLLLFGENAAATALFSAVVQSSLESFAALFETELEGELLAIVYPDRWDTAEAYRDSFVLAATQPMTNAGVAIWGQSVAHELFHLWNGGRMRAESWADSNWFLEGITHYLASLLLVRKGFVDQDVFLDQLEKHVAFYRLYHKGPPFSGVDLVTAGAEKGVNNAAIYDGGWLTAFALDIELQERTRAAAGIEEYLRELLSWSAGSAQGYDNAVLVRLLDELSDSDFGPFFSRHVEGTQPLDLPALCARAGIDLRLGAEQAHARLDPEANEFAQRVRARLLHGAFDAARRELSGKIDALFARYSTASGPGAALTISRAGRVLHSRGYGLADLERSHPIRPDTVFHAASVSKQFTAFSILLLEAEGILSTDDPVLEWLPELTCAQDVRIRHLLEHTSGMRDQWQLLGLCGVRPNGDVISQEDVLALLFRQEELSFDPGTQQAYCNSGYTLLAEIVARASGVPFPRFTRERIFEPLGMTRTHFQESPRALVADRALSYSDTNGAFESVPIAFGTYGATGLMTTTEDLVRWARNAWDTRVGTQALHERMLERGMLADGTQVNFTNGLQVRTWQGNEIFGHPGADAGYRSAVVVAPEQRLAIALLGNVDSVDMWGLPDLLLELLLEKGNEPESEEAAVAEKTESEPLDPSQPRSKPDLKELTGRYYSRELDTSYDLELVDNALHARHLRNGLLALEWAGDDRFLCDRWYLNELKIERDEQGAPIAFRASSARSRGIRFVKGSPSPGER